MMRGITFECLKGKDSWAKKLDRGSFRWFRENEMLALQWKDTKVVTFLTTLDCADESCEVSRKTKNNGKWNQPLSIDTTNS